MIFAYLLIGAAPAKEHEVYNALRRLEGVNEVHPLFGEYDLIVKLEEETIGKIKEIIAEEIEPIDGILVMKTLSSLHF